MHLRTTTVLVVVGSALLCATSVGSAQRALVIGINEYPELGPGRALEGCVNDATSVRDVLEEVGVEVTVLLDAQATRQGILDALDRLAAGASEQVPLFVYYAGYGTQHEDGKKALLTHQSEPGLGEESEDITLAELAGLLRRAPAAHRSVVLDCSFRPDGGLDRELGRPRYFGRDLVVAGPGLALPIPGFDAELSSPGVSFYTSDAWGLSGGETTLGGVVHGPFTYTLTAQLAEEAEVDGDLQVAGFWQKAKCFLAKVGLPIIRMVLGPLSDILEQVIAGTREIPGYSADGLVKLLCKDKKRLIEVLEDARDSSRLAAEEGGGISGGRVGPGGTLGDLVFGESLPTRAVTLRMSPSADGKEIGVGDRFTFSVGTQYDGILVVVNRDRDQQLRLLQAPTPVAAGQGLSLPQGGRQFAAQQPGRQRVRALLLPSTSTRMAAALDQAFAASRTITVSEFLEQAQTVAWVASRDGGFGVAPWPGAGSSWGGGGFEVDEPPANVGWGYASEVRFVIR